MDERQQLKKRLRAACTAVLQRDLLSLSGIGRYAQVCIPIIRTQVVYGDTDSLFVELPGRSRAEAFSIGREIAAEVTAQNPHPMELELEKASGSSHAGWLPPCLNCGGGCSC